MRTPHLKHVQIIRLSRILDMMYKPSELAAEIGVIPDTIYRSYLPAGMPHIRRGHTLWIYGPAFVEWAKATAVKHKRKRAGLPDDHGWCMKCNAAVLMNNPKVKYTNQYIQIYQARCPVCGTVVNRASKREEGAA